MATQTTVRYNVVTHPTKVLVKTIEVQADGTLKKSHGGQIPKGSTITSKETPLSKYVRDVFDGGVHQYVLPSNVILGESIPISPKEFVVDGGVDRSSKTLIYNSGPAPLTFDHDKSPYTTVEVGGPEEFHAILVKEFPNVFQHAAWGAYDSSGSFIYDQLGNKVAGRRGFHVVFAVNNATQIKVFCERLFKLLWLRGYGYCHISRDGKALLRTIFDTKVVEPQQPLFAGGAHCIKCEQRRPPPTYTEGDYVNMQGLPELSESEEREFHGLIDRAKRAAQPECTRKRHEYLDQKTDEIASSQNISLHQARQIVEKRLGGTLIGSDVLVFDVFGRITVAEVLKDPKKYNEATLADPIEGGTPDKAILFTNEATGNPLIYSHAHGGNLFFLKHDLSSALAWLAGMNSSEAQSHWHTPLLNAELRSDETECYLRKVKQMTGISIGALRKSLAALLSDMTHHDTSSLLQDPGVYLAEKLLTENYKNNSLLMLETRQFWLYTGTHWRPIKDTVIASELQKIANSEWKHINAMWAAQGKKSSTMAALVSSALVCLGHTIVQAGDPLHLNSARQSIINCLNGEVWLEQNGPVLKPHNRESFLTFCSPIVYDSDATAPLFESAMRGILSLPGGEAMPDQEEMVRHVVELIAYSIQPSRNIKMFVIVMGPGDNGKTTFTKILRLILGEDAIVYDRLSGVDESGNRFAAGRLVGKLVLVDDDMSHEYLLPDGLLKKIAEEKPLTAEMKFKDNFSFVSQVVPWLLGNSWPRTRDLTRGMQTRANVIYLPRSFLKVAECGEDHPDRQRPEIWAKVYSEEMPGVLNRMINAYYTLNQRGGFLPPESAQKAFDMWLSDANIVARFLSDACERIGPSEPGCLSSTMYHCFNEWCCVNGVLERHRPQANQMKHRLIEIGVKVQHTDKGTAIYGYRPKNGLSLSNDQFAKPKSSRKSARKRN